MGKPVIPAKAPRRKYPWGAGIQYPLIRLAGAAFPAVKFRVKPGMTRFFKSVRFNVTDY
jgi:hypothetical protein